MKTYGCWNRTRSGEGGFSFSFHIISIRNINRGKNNKTKKEILTGDIWAVAFSAVVLIIIFSQKAKNNF